MRFHVPSALLFASAVAPLAAQEAPSVILSGEIRLRAEWDGRTAGAGDDAATLSRIRLGALARLRAWLSAFVQVQDARAWGTETNPTTDASADQLDLHQGYVDVGAYGFIGRFGRQELALGDERLVGPLLWSNTTRAFDGVAVARAFERGELRLFWMNVAERDALTAAGVDPQANEGDDADGWFLGGFYARRLGNAAIEIMLLHDRNAQTDASYTAHARAYGRAGSLLYDGSGAFQFGPDRRAFLLSGKLGAVVGEGGSVAAQLDYVSGDDDPLDATRRAFATLYPTAHAYHGYMDYFLLFPAQTQEAGLIDAMARAVAPLPRPWSLRGDVHYFALASARGGERGLGAEGDVVLGRALAPGAGLELGASVFVPRDLVGAVLPAFGLGTDDPTYWAYLSLLVRF